MRSRHVKYGWLVPDFDFFFFPYDTCYETVIHAVGIGTMVTIIGEAKVLAPVACGTVSSR